MPPPIPRPDVLGSGPTDGLCGAHAERTLVGGSTADDDDAERIIGGAERSGPMGDATTTTGVPGRAVGESCPAPGPSRDAATMPRSLYGRVVGG
jgi:hypothetical protein